MAPDAGEVLGQRLQCRRLVMIQGGIFDGYEAIFDTRLAGTERVRVLLKLLKVRQMNLELPAAQIQRKKGR